jgi:uncharacterized protein
MTAPSHAPLGIDLSPDERRTLDEFLASPGFDERAMDLATLEGFLTALVIGPNIIMPSQWIPWIWDRIDGQVPPPFEDPDEANAILGLVMRLYNGLIDRFQTDPEAFRPVYLDGAEWGASEWCEGFMIGTRLDADTWSLLMAADKTLLAPFLRLGTDDGLERTLRDEDGERWLEGIVPSLVKIRAFWLERRQSARDPRGLRTGAPPPRAQQPVVHATPKIGRNDPCPCGSGKKYKKCCGAPSSSLH